MVYRVTVDVSFSDEKTAQAILAYIESFKEEMWVPLPEKGIDQKRVCEYHTCYHDEDVPKPCEGYVRADLTRSDEQAVLAAYAEQKAEAQAVKDASLNTATGG